MKYRSGYKAGIYLILFLGLLLCSLSAYSQSALPTGSGNQSTTLPNGAQKDTTLNKSNTKKWKDESARIYYEKLSSSRKYIPDTSIHTFERNPFLQPWYRDLGNLGSPADNLLFTPENHFGPSLGYHVFDAYRFDIDSLNYYNTTRPYSAFGYQLGSKLEQYASIMHTQNVRPNWNFAVKYMKLNSPGYFVTERNNNDNASLTTNYKSLDKHYVLYAAMVYNKEQHDENGGIADSELTDPTYNDRRTIDAPYKNAPYSLTRSPIFNVEREFTMVLQHSYTWGVTDTTYNTDSTQYTYQLHPRFSISHKMEISTEKHMFKDLTPDSLRYVSLFNQNFINAGTGFYVQGQDSVVTQQEWFWIDNNIMLNGFIGPESKQLKFSAGIGSRYDEFISTPVRDSVAPQVYISGIDRSSTVSNYVQGQLIKEALTPAAWQYGADAKFFFTGQDAGNFLLNAMLGKQLRHDAGGFLVGFQQQLNSAPYSYTNYENLYTKHFYNLSNESVTSVYGTFESPRLRLSAGVKEYLIENYIYINEAEVPAQYTIPFSMLQMWVRKVFKVGNFHLDNEFVYQPQPGIEPVNVPEFMGRNQFSYESALFKRNLKLVTGVEVRYNTAYYVPGYDALLNKFYYQHTNYVGNTPELAVFLNFRIKNFRAFAMADNLQELFSRNTILYTGTPVPGVSGSGFTPVYAAPNALFRFGFSWVMIN